MTLTPALLAPAPAQAAPMDGKLPRGFYRSRLVDLPMFWSEQWRGCRPGCGGNRLA